MRKAAKLLCMLLLWPTMAHAHPHAFIDLQTTVIFEKGLAVAIREHWVFDKYYTEFALHDFAYKDKQGGLDRAKLLELARENLKNLQDYNYFTQLADRPQVTLGAAKDINSTVEHGQVAMEFTLALTPPVDPRQQPLVFRIYDPSYYTAMAHVKDSPVTLQNAPADCKAAVQHPKPDLVWTSLASALDKNAQAPDDLGRYFAETVRVTCK